MDFFGIGAAMRGMALTYFQAARRTGRTTALLHILKDGDRVFCLDTPQAAILQRLCRERKLKVECLAMPPGDIYRIADQMNKWPTLGRTFFDHTWVEQYYIDAIRHATTCLTDLQRLGADPDIGQKDTRRMHAEIMKWKY